MKHLSIANHHHSRPRIACLLSALTISLWLSLTGCSILVAPPPSAHVHIDGLNHQVGEFSVALNPFNEQQMDIHLGNHYALRLNFNWLWNRENESHLYFEQDPDNWEPPLTPWMTCKYHF
jgi:hypothetical protein